MSLLFPSFLHTIDRLYFQKPCLRVPSALLLLLGSALSFSRKETLPLVGFATVPQRDWPEEVSLESGSRRWTYCCGAKVQIRDQGLRRDSKERISTSQARNPTQETLLAFHVNSCWWLAFAESLNLAIPLRDFQRFLFSSFLSFPTVTVQLVLGQLEGKDDEAEEEV